MFYATFFSFFFSIFKDSEEDIKEMSYEEILELGETENIALYYYPNLKVCYLFYLLYI